MPGSLPERKLIFQLSTLVFQVLLLSTNIMSQTFPLTWKKQLENKVKTGCHPRTKHGTWKCSLGLSETPGYKLPDSSPKHGRAKIGASNSSYISKYVHFPLPSSGIKPEWKPGTKSQWNSSQVDPPSNPHSRFSKATLHHVQSHANNWEVHEIYEHITNFFLS